MQEVYLYSNIETNVENSVFPEHIVDRPLLVMKFGGTSVGDARRINQVTNIVDKYKREGKAVVVIASAMAGVTNDLIALCGATNEGSLETKEKYIRSLLDIHMTVALELRLSPNSRRNLHNNLRELFVALRKEVRDVNRELSLEERDSILSYGERLCIRLIEASFITRGARALAIDSTQLILTDENFGNGSPNLEGTQMRAFPILAPLLENEVIPVITGFLGSTSEGKITTLGRGGSDYSASFIARTVNADEVWIWTDVDGVFTADPNQDASARIIEKMTYQEADIMAKSGAKVLHSRTLEPLFGTQITLRVKNTFKPDFPGTEVY